MTSQQLAQDYVRRCRSRLAAIKVLIDSGNYPDAIRESQETVELLLKALLRACHIDPPHWHEVSSVLEENQEKLSKKIVHNFPKIAKLSKDLRKERELAFYGDEDFIPSLEYSKDMAEHFVSEVQWLFKLIEAEVQ
ncbi:MAG: DNA-binding protein [Bdellovibrio sp.]|nr:MAG: DNA-binding protein [Bdellovibrio sp.]